MEREVCEGELGLLLMGSFLSGCIGTMMGAGMAVPAQQTGGGEREQSGVG